METPIAFGTDGWRADLETFTTDRVRIVAQAVATYLADHGLTGAPIAIGYDARESSRGFADAVADVLLANGIDVRRMPRDLPTPLLAWQIAERRCSGGIMITASHNPPEYNGVKFITAAGAPALPTVTDALEARLAEPRQLPAAGADDRLADPRTAYLDHVRDLVDVAGIDGLSVCYDAMHGSGRGVTDRLLKACGAAVMTYRCTRDPTFGGGAPEPTAARLGTLARAVARHDADLGIANDGDADRIVVATPDRGILDANLLYAALYDYLLEDDAGPAVRTVSTSHLIDRIAAAHDEDVIETAVGFKWVAAAMREHDALIGGEESGGYGIRGHVREKDGVLMAALICAMTAAEPIDARIDRLLDEYGRIVQDKISIECRDGEKEAVLEALDGAVPESIAGSDVADVATVDGCKITLADGCWVLVRPSGTEPVLRVYAEAPDRDRVEEVLAAGRSIVEPIV